MVSGIFAGAVGGAGISIIIKAIDQYSKEFRKLDKTVKKQEKGFKKLTNFLSKTGIGFGLLAGAAAGFAIESIKAFIETERAAQAFNIVVGETADLLLNDLRKASKGMVSDFNLMQAANNALALGIDKNKLPELMKIAAARGKVMGRTVTEAFNDITIGIGRQSRMILDNLGIIINASEAYEKYALVINKTADQLTELEKKQAFVNEVIQQSVGITAALSAVEETHGEKLARLSALWSNLKDDMGESSIEAIDLGIEFGRLVSLYDIWSDDIRSPEVQKALEEQGKAISETADSMRRLRDEQAGFISDLRGLTSKPNPEEIASRILIAEQQAELNNLAVVGVKLKEDDFKLTQKETAALKERGNVGDTLEKQREELSLRQEEFNLQLEEENIELDRLRAQYDLNFDSWKRLTDLQIESELAHRSQSKTTKKEVTKNILTIIKAWDDNILKIKDLEKEQKVLAEKSDVLANEVISDVERMISAYDRLRRAISRTISRSTPVGLFNKDNDDGPTQLARGGVVTKPTLALIGEAGPEAVIPLNKTGGFGGNVTIIIEGSLVSETEMVERVGEALQDSLNIAQKAF